MGLYLHLQERHEEPWTFGFTRISPINFFKLLLSPFSHLTNHTLTSSFLHSLHLTTLSSLKHSLCLAILPVVGLSFFYIELSIFFYNEGSSELSSSSMTLVSGFLAVISVNLVIVIYIFLAMKEPANRLHQPDPSFLAAAKASINHPMSSGSCSEDAVIREKTD